MQDIEDPNHLSLEEEKRRTAEEKQAKAGKLKFLKICPVFVKFNCFYFQWKQIN